MEAAAAAMDFHSLSRRELQALCKRNGVRANMTNVAMADALQGLDSVDGIDEIGTTLCLPTPGRSAMKSAAKVVVVDEQQHGSPLPRGRRVSVKSPEAIRMEVEGGEDEMKEMVVKTPGVALRSTRRGTRATPAPLPTPAPACSTRATARRTAARKTAEVAPTPATRRSQRTASRKAAEAVEADRTAEDVSEEQISKMTIALDQEAEVVAAASKEEKVLQDEPQAVSDVQCDEEEKVRQEEPKAVASDMKCDDPEREKAAKFLEGDNKEEELEEGEEADSYDATTGSAAVSVRSCTDPKVEEVVVVLEEQPTKPPEEIVKELEPISAEKSAPLTVMEDSPILGVIDKEQDAPVEDGEDLAELSLEREMTDEIIPVTEDKEVAINEEQDASVEECEDLAELSPAREMTNEIIPATEDKDKEVAINEEAIKEDGFADAVETDPTSKEILLTPAGEDETIEEDEVILPEGKEGAAFETIEEDEEADLTELKEGAVDEVPQAELADNETSEEDDDLTEVREGSAAKILPGELIDAETSEDDGLDDNETSEEDEDDLTEVREGPAAKMLQGELIDDETSEDDLDEDEEWASDDENTEEMDSTDESDEDTDVTNEESHTADAVQMLQGTEEMDSIDGSDEDTDETNEESHTADAVQMLQGTGIAEEANEDDCTEDDDFSGELPPEFDNLMIFSDAETESDLAPPVLEENQAAIASATKTVKSLDYSAMNAEQQEGPEEADATEKAMKEVDNIVKSLDEFTFKEGESEEMQNQQPQDYNSMSLRKLKTTYKKLIAEKQEKKQEETTEGKRLPLEEVDRNAC